MMVKDTAFDAATPGFCTVTKADPAAAVRPAGTSAFEPASIVGLAVGLVICLPMILHQLLRLARRVSRHSDDPAARLAVAELRSSPTRSVAMLAIVAAI